MTKKLPNILIRAALPLIFALASCTDHKGERALSGFAIGSAAGSPVVVGAILGAGIAEPNPLVLGLGLAAPIIGATIGLATTTEEIDIDGHGAP